MKFIQEFKEFISRGNVIDMAVGVVVGGAFKAIVDSLVADIIMPCVSILGGQVNVADLKAVIIEAKADGTGGLVIPYGNFIQQVVNFLIIAFAIFCTIKILSSIKAKFEKPKEAEKEVSAPTVEELLTEIRDIMAEK